MSAERIWELMGRKLSSQASAEELQELDHLLRTHADLHFSVQTINDLWQQDYTTPTNDQLEAAYDQHLQRMEQKGITFNKELPEPAADPNWLIESESKPKRRFLQTWALAAAAILIIGAWWLFLFMPKNIGSIGSDQLASNSTVSEIATEYGSRTTQKLPDGSRVWLNAGSKLTFSKEFGESTREVTLTGEAFFDVVKNPEKPFVIHTSTIDVKVLGTQFNVKSYPTDKTTETSLIKGSVEVVVRNHPNEKYVLKPNEKLVVPNQELKIVGTNDITGPGRILTKDNIPAIRNLTYQKGDTSDVESAWIRNKLSIKDMPFSEMAKIMERWYDVSFVFRNKKLEEVFITGSFDNETLAQALEALQFSFAFNYEINDKTVTVY
jgi:ferric-dicitrate binding protein FerR (iron transport regulator)